MAFVSVLTLDGTAPNSKTKLYLKYSDEINEYILSRIDHFKFKKEVHKEVQNSKSFAIKYRNEELLKEMERRLAKKRISVQRIKRVSSAIMARTEESFNKLKGLDKHIMINALENAKYTKRLYDYNAHVSDAEFKLIAKKKVERSKWTTGIKKKRKDDIKTKMTRALMPYIFNFAMQHIDKKLPGRSNEAIEKMAIVMFEDPYYSDILDDVLKDFEKQYGRLEKACEHFKIDINAL